jgi:hypothetical protein
MTSDAKIALSNAISEGMLTENLKTLRVLHQLLMVTPTTASPATLRCCVASGSYQRNQRCDHKICWKELLASRGPNVTSPSAFEA